VTNAAIRRLFIAHKYLAVTNLLGERRLGQRAGMSLEDAYGAEHFAATFAATLPVLAPVVTTLSDKKKVA
jgi:hypothetical protein